MLSLRPLTPAHAADYLAFFDTDAFADNPEWASCYCHCFHVPTAEAWDACTAAGNREAVAARIVAGRHHGWLAYEGDRVIGFVHAAPQVEVPNARGRMGIPGEDDAGVGVILCFTIAAPTRGRGVARALLGAACDGFRAAGLHTVEAYPNDPAVAENAADNFHGPLAMFLDEGFAEVATVGHRRVVRRSLAPG
jgi:GNAT superfamily N-acetyltransferase